MNKDSRCNNCGFFDRADADDPTGLCRRHAPRPAADSREEDGQNYASWPVVGYFDWCGEWRELEEDQSAVFTLTAGGPRLA